MFGFFRLLRLILFAFIALMVAWWIANRAEAADRPYEFVAAPGAVFIDWSYRK